MVKENKIGDTKRNKYGMLCMWSACIDCGVERWVRICKGKIRSYKCVRCAHSPNNREKNGMWKNGLIEDEKGYILYNLPNGHKFESMICKERYVRVHRLVMAEYLNRPLKPEEVVHHINGNKKDNRIENLMLFKNTGNHSAFHHKLRKRLMEVV